jgi:hypothetical protein
MPADLRFPLYALADLGTSKTVFRGSANDLRMLLFTSAENASHYRASQELSASVVRLREPKDLRMLLSLQGDQVTFGVEIDPAEAEK